MSNKVGCFGSILYHDADSRRCGACPHMAACAEQVATNKEQLSEWFAKLQAGNKAAKITRKMVSVPSAAVASSTSTPSAVVVDDGEAITNDKGIASSTLNKNPRKYVEAWAKKGVNHKVCLEGINGFATCGNKWAIVAMDFLLRVRSCTKEELADEFIAKLNWGQGTAGSHMNIAFDAFEFLGLITVSGNRATMR